MTQQYNIPQIIQIEKKGEQSKKVEKNYRRLAYKIKNPFRGV